MKSTLQRIDFQLSKIMWRAGRPALRISFAIIFVWFGILKPLGLSPAEDLLKQTVVWLPFGSPDLWLDVIGYWEVAIGLLFLFKKTVRFAIGLLFLQMVGTFMPLVVLPHITFQGSNILALTMEGQYIVKNLFLISSALILGGDLYEYKVQAETEPKLQKT